MYGRTTEARPPTCEGCIAWQALPHADLCRELIRAGACQVIAWQRAQVVGIIVVREREGWET